MPARVAYTFDSATAQAGKMPAAPVQAGCLRSQATEAQAWSRRANLSRDGFLHPRREDNKR